MTDQFGLGKLDENEALLPIDISDAVLYVLGTPQRVNVSQLKSMIILIIASYYILDFLWIRQYLFKRELKNIRFEIINRNVVKIFG